MSTASISAAMANPLVKSAIEPRTSLSAIFLKFLLHLKDSDFTQAQQRSNDWKLEGSDTEPLVDRASYLNKTHFGTALGMGFTWTVSLIELLIRVTIFVLSTIFVFGVAVKKCREGQTKAIASVAKQLGIYAVPLLKVDMPKLTKDLATKWEVNLNNKDTKSAIEKAIEYALDKTINLNDVKKAPDNCKFIDSTGFLLVDENEFFKQANKLPEYSLAEVDGLAVLNTKKGFLIDPKCFVDINSGHISHPFIAFELKAMDIDRFRINLNKKVPTFQENSLPQGHVLSTERKEDIQKDSNRQVLIVYEEAQGRPVKDGKICDPEGNLLKTSVRLQRDDDGKTNSLIEKYYKLAPPKSPPRLMQFHEINPQNQVTGTCKGIPLLIHNIYKQPEGAVLNEDGFVIDPKTNKPGVSICILIGKDGEKKRAYYMRRLSKAIEESTNPSLTLTIKDKIKDGEYSLSCLLDYASKNFVSLTLKPYLDTGRFAIYLEGKHPLILEGKHPLIIDSKNEDFKAIKGAIQAYNKNIDDQLKKLITALDAGLQEKAILKETLLDKEKHKVNIKDGTVSIIYASNEAPPRGVNIDVDGFQINAADKRMPKLHPFLTSKGEVKIAHLYTKYVKSTDKEI